MIDDALLKLLEPLVRRAVREELERRERELRWVTARQAAEALDVSVEAIYQRVHRGQLPHRRLDGRLYIDLGSFYESLEDGVQ